MNISDPFIQIVSTPTGAGWANPLAWGPMIALVGVIATNWWTGRNMIRAETLRGHEALKAERVRHDNALAQRADDWLREIKTRTYSQLLLSDQKASMCLVDFIWDLDQVSDSAIGDAVQRAMVEIDNLLSAAYAEISLVRSVGSLEIALVADNILALTRRSSGVTLELYRAGDYDPTVAQSAYLRDREPLLEELTNLVRDDLLLRPALGAEGALGVSAP